MSMFSSVMDLLGNYAYHALSTLLLGYMLFRQLKTGSSCNPKRLPLPPGPKGYPLIGNLLDMPIYKPWLVYDEWFKTYGDIVYLNVLGISFLVLGSQKRTTDLFDKRSSIYSDRMSSTMLIDLMGWDFSFGSLPYGELWRKHRKSFHEYAHLNAVTKYIPTQKREVHAFLRRLLVTPENFFDHIRLAFAASIMDITYGIEIQNCNNPYIARVEEALVGLNEAAVPGAFWVDLFPALKYVPSWFPGAGFRKKAAHWRKVNEAVIEKPFDYVKNQLKNGKAPPSIAASLIERLPDVDDPRRAVEEMIAQNVTAVVYVGGADTTLSSVQALFLAMALYPEVQKKAQAEIDAVIGPNRLPEFEDRSSLPYISAVVKESKRWHLVVPVGIPHMTSDEDEYDGYYIPKGTAVLGSAWSILHDSKTFNDPEEFRPERFLKDGQLDPDVLDPASVAFGFGRRICPGRHLSENSLYIIASCLIAVYDIQPPVDDQGNPIELKYEPTSGLVVSYPAPFKCIIKPRSRAAEALIQGSAEA